MDARQLITELEELIKQHGNRPVVIDAGQPHDLQVIDMVDMDAEGDSFVIWMPDYFYDGGKAA